MTQRQPDAAPAAGPGQSQQTNPQQGAHPAQQQATKGRLGGLDLLRSLPGMPGPGRGRPGEQAAPVPLRPTLVVPPQPPDTVLLDEREVRPGLCVIRLLRDEAQGVLVYQVLEPVLDDDERAVLAFIKEGLLRSLTARPEDATPEEAERVLTERVDELVEEHRVRIDAASRMRLLYYIHRDLAGFGPIDALMRDPDIEDISCDGPRIPVFLFHRKHEAVRTTVEFPAGQDLDAFVLRLAQRAGRHVSVANPLLDATLPDKSRLQCTYGSEVTTRGSSFTIRKFRADPITPPMLLSLGTVGPEVAGFFWLAIEHGQSGLFVGGTASGKTTTLNAFSLFIPGQRKIVSIEDTRELNLPHENWVAGVTRGGGGELIGSRFAGEVNMFDLLAAALRQRPEYLLVGEVRGREAMTLFQAMATGHATYSTMHADSMGGCIHRLENEPISVPRVMLESLQLVALQAQVRVGQRLVRRMKEVAEVKGLDPTTGDVITNTVFRWDGATDSFHRSPRSYTLDRIATRLQTSAEALWDEVDRRAEVLRWMERERLVDYLEVAGVVDRYRHDPDGLLAEIREARADGHLGPAPDAAQRRRGQGLPPAAGAHGGAGR